MAALLKRGPLALVAAALTALCIAALVHVRAQTASDTLPKQLSDQAFWKMVVDFSEPEGLFRSDNFVSNETTFQEVIPDLKKRVSPDGVYLGVGPDQNFTYIAALRPRMAFIVDIRRQNLVQHLFYKALIEMSENRAEFLSRLFSRARPARLSDSLPPAALFDAFRSVEPDDKALEKNLQEVKDRLVVRHKFELTVEDLQRLDYVYRAFFTMGPDLRYSFPRQRQAPWFPTYAELMLQQDLGGINHSYMASEQNYRTLREFERRNLVVPVVGDFSGTKALRSVGAFLKTHGATVNYFYTSNVEQYLFQDDAYRRYYNNVASLPLNANSAFIRSYFNAGFMYPPGIVTPDLHSVQLVDPILPFLDAFRADAVNSYTDVVERSR
jgi:hypothetical protein